MSGIIDLLWKCPHDGSTFRIVALSLPTIQTDAVVEWSGRMVNLPIGFELVHSIYDYWDQPRSGVADYNGEAHWFERIFDKHRDDYSDDYWLTPLSPEAFAAVKEQSKIFWKWRTAFDRGEVNLSTHPALPGDTERFKSLNAEIQREIIKNVDRRFKVHGRFKPVDPAAPFQEISNFQVKWGD